MPDDDKFMGQHGQWTDDRGLNIPIPDPTDKTLVAVREAIQQLSLLVDSKMGGIQAVIAEQFRSIEKRISDRDVNLLTATAAQKETVATALAAVIEASKSGSIRFDLLERRVAALELAISNTVGKSTGTSVLSTGLLQAVATAAAVLMALFAYFALNHDAIK